MVDLRPLSVIRLCDTETTGFPPHAELVEIGWTDLRFYPGGWEIEIDQQSAFVNPGFPIPASATEIHGITDAMVVDGMLPDDARKMLARGADYLSAHNVEFDSKFVRGHNLPWICTLQCARHVWPDAPNHKNETLKEFLGITVDGDAHRAGYDAAVSARILLKLFEVMTIDEMIAVSKPSHVPLRMPFGKCKGMLFKDIDHGYLDWITRSNLPVGIRNAAKSELQKRRETTVAQPANADWDRMSF